MIGAIVGGVEWVAKEALLTTAEIAIGIPRGIVGPAIRLSYELDYRLGYRDENFNRIKHAAGSSPRKHRRAHRHHIRHHVRMHNRRHAASWLRNLASGATDLASYLP